MAHQNWDICKQRTLIVERKNESEWGGEKKNKEYHQTLWQLQAVKYRYN